MQTTHPRITVTELLEIGRRQLSQAGKYDPKLRQELDSLSLRKFLNLFWGKSSFLSELFSTIRRAN
jgi:hypothetical protein